MRWTRAKYHYAIRKAKRKANMMKSAKFREASLEGNAALLTEMKSALVSRRTQQPVFDSLDGNVSAEDIDARCRDVYQSLYNSANTDEKMETIKRNMEMIRQVARQGLLKIIFDVGNDAFCRMKPGKLA